MAPKGAKKHQWLCSKKVCKKNSDNSDTESPVMNFTPKLNKNRMQIRFGKHTVQCLVDTGADISAISRHLLNQVAPNTEIKPSTTSKIVGVCGEVHRVLGQVELDFECQGLHFKQRFQVFEHLHVSILVGLDFMKAYKVTVKFGEVEIAVLSHDNASVSSVKVEATPVTNDQTCFAYTTRVVVVPPHSEVLVPVRISGFPSNSVVLIEPKLNLSELNLAGGKNVCKIHNSKGVYRLMNPTNLPVFLSANQRLAKVQLVDDQSIFELKESNSVHVMGLSTDSGSQTLDSEKIVKDLGINLDDTDLTVDQKDKLYGFLARNRDIFAKDMSELGVTNLHSHVIDTGDHAPVSSAPYRQTPKMRAELERQLDEMLKQGIIEESNSVWHSPVVMVKKPNNEWRFCVDYRKLNAVTELMSFPIPHMSDVFDTLAQSKAEIFSTLDLRSGFWQVPLDKSTKSKSAFITHQGIFEFNRLSFGMVNAPMTFQSLMTKVLKSLNFKIALVYIDDLLIFSKDFDQHLHHLNLVFENLRSANLTLHPSKCKFATKQVKYLGHYVSKDGLRVNPENTEKIRNCKSPINVKQLRSALGMMGYYRKFVKDYAKIAQPLNNLLKKDTKFQWSEDCENAFNVLKTKLIEAPILRYPEFDKEFILSVDSSEYSIGFVLSQEQEGKLHPICFGGRALRDNELKWHITDKEGLALVEGIQHFKHYLANQKFIVYTDNVSVKYLQKIKDCQGRLGRWGILLQGYTFDIRHRSGSQNCTADFLSRQRYDDSEPTESSDLADHIYSLGTHEYTQLTLVYPGDDDTEVLLAETMAAEAGTEPDDRDISIGIAVYQQECPDFRDIYKYLVHRQVPENPQLARTVVAESYNYEMEDGILKHFYTKRSRQVPVEERLVKQTAVPKCLRDELLKSYHDCIAGGGHQGFERTYAALRNKYYWPSMYDNIRQYVKTCEVCQQSKRAFNAKPPPLQPQPVDDVFGRWQMDILSGVPTTRDKYKHILVLVDSYSKWVELFPLRTQEASEVASVLFKEIISRYGAPRSILSDRGQSFMAKLVKALSELFEIKRYFTSPYHPMTNGLTECKNTYILQALRAYCKGQQDDWPEILPGIMMAYRSTPATQSTQYSPFFMLYGREMRLPIDTVLQPKDHLPQNCKVHLSRILQNLEVCRKLAGQNIKAAQDKYKHQYDKRTKVPDYHPAQRVWLYCTKVPVGKAPKLHRKWVGPYYITMLGPNHTYRLRNCKTNAEVRSLVNAMRLKPYYDPEDRPTNPPEPLLDSQEELDPEELDQTQRNRNAEDTNKNEENTNVQPKGNTNNARRTKENIRRIDDENKRGGKETPVQKKQIQRKERTQNDEQIQEGNDDTQRKERQSKVVQKEGKQNKATNHDTQRQAGQKNTEGKTKVDKGRQNKGTNKDTLRDMEKTNTNDHSEVQQNKGSNNGSNTKPGQKKAKQNKALELNNEKQQAEAKVNKQGNDTKTNGKRKTKGLNKCKNGKDKLDDQNKHANDSKGIQDKQKGSNDTIESKLKGSKVPSCKACKTNSCIKFNADEIKAIVSSQRSNGALYYKVKWSNGTSDWYFPCKIPDNLIREYHVHRTMSGKKRKKPLQKGHKFFAETDHTVNVVESPTNTEQNDTSINELSNETKLVGVKLIKGRSYYIMQKGNSVPEVQPTTMAHWHARRFILYLIKYFKEDLEECKVNAIRNRPVPNPSNGLKAVLCDSVHEICIEEDGTVLFLVSYRSPHLPPDWVTLEELATGSLNILIELMKRDYYAAIGKRI